MEVPSGAVSVLCRHRRPFLSVGPRRAPLATIGMRLSRTPSLTLTLRLTSDPRFEVEFWGKTLSM